MGANKIPKGEMPAIFNRLNKYDTDRSGGLNPEELEKLGADNMDDVVHVFGYGHIQHPCESCESPRVSYNQAVEVLQKLKPDLRTHVIRGLHNYDFLSQNKYYSNEFLKRLAASNLRPPDLSQ